MKKITYVFISLLIFSINCNSQLVKIITTYGNITIKLYDETPMHKENFLKLVSNKFYDGLLFHRVINNFMIQTGDPKSKNAKPDKLLGQGGVNYTIPPEFNKQLYHKKGAVAAARLPDNINPNKESSGSQFYIVQGKKYTETQLIAMEKNNYHIKFTEQQKKDYINIGGTPHLDYSYTVFGEVIEGLEIIDKIASQPTDKYDRPIKDIKIIKMVLVE